MGVDTSLDTYKETELGLLPEAWNVTKIGELFSIQQGKALSQKQRQGNSQFPFLRTSNVLWGRLDLSALDEMNFTDDQRSRYELRVGDLLICEGGEIGRTAIWNEEVENCYIQNHVFRVRAKGDNVKPAFYMYWMQAALTILGLYQGYGNRTTIPNLSKTRLSSFPIPLPPRPEQERIAEVLSTLQNAIEAQKRLVNAARELKRSLLHRLFTYGPFAEEMLTKETKIGVIPEHWEVVRLGKHVKLRAGGTPSRKNSAYWHGTIPWIKTAEISYQPITSADEYITEDGLNNSSAKLFPVGTLLMAMYGQGVTRGRVAILAIEAATNQACVALFPNERLDTHFLYYYLAYDYERIRNFGHGANQKNLSAKIIELISIPVPPLSEQKRIAELLAPLDRKISVELSRKLSLQALFNSMLQNLMTGQIRVNDLELAVASEEAKDGDTMPETIVVLEWTFSPPDYFEDEIRLKRDDYEMLIGRGKVEAKIEPEVFDDNPHMREEIHSALNSRFLGVQLLTHKSYELSESSITRLHPDGRRDVTVSLEPLVLKVSVGSVDAIAKDRDGNVISDSRKDRIERKKALADLVEKFRGDNSTALSLLNSYKEAVRDPNDELVHLYEIRDTLTKEFGGEKAARQTLKISAAPWSRFGQLANSEPLKQGRHRGKNPATLRDATEAELTEARSIARYFIEAYLKHLEMLNKS